MNKLLFRLFRNNEIKVHELNYLFWECTSRCNLHCRHCGSDCGNEVRYQDMPLEDFLRALDTIPSKHRPKGFTVVLTGGEPLLRPDILQIGRSVSSRGLGWGMVSNGYFYNEEMHHNLIASGMGALTISLDGTKENHNWMRGKSDCYEHTLKAISIAAREPRLNFDVVTCVNRKNIGELETIFGILEGLGVRKWRLFTIIPIGRAANNPDMLLSDDELLSLMHFIEAHRKSTSTLSVSFSCEGYLGPFEEKVRDNRFFCHAGINIASILIDGSINACPNIDRAAFNQGNIYQDNFYEVWENGFLAFRNRQWARKGQCADCPVWRNCLGDGMHNWHGNLDSVLTCHYSRIMSAIGQHS